MEPPPPLEICTARRSRKRAFSGGEGSSWMDDDVIEIPPPLTFSRSKSSKQKLKQKQVVFHEVIDVDNDVDNDVDSDDLMIIEEKCSNSSKGKRAVSSYVSGLDVTPTVNLSKGASSISHNVSITDNGAYDMSYWGDDQADFKHNPVIYDEECALLQAHFDSLDAPPGVETPVSWWPDSNDNKNQSVPASSSAFISQSSLNNAGISKVNDSQSPWTNKKSSHTRPRSVQPKIKTFLPSYVGEQVYSAPLQPALSIHAQQQSPLNSNWPYSVATSSWKSNSSAAAVGNPLSAGTPLPPKNVAGVNNSFTGWNATGQDKMTFPAIPPALSSFITATTAASGYYQNYSVAVDQGIAAEISVPPDLHYSHLDDNAEIPIVKRLESFKQFDIVQDYSDHHYSSNKHSRPSKPWVKKIQEEWRILEKDLPDTIYVRVYETRMDLLRAVIIAADGTPYHDGIFFFDVHFPSTYPNKPPLVHYHSGGLRLNPNLYNCGKVCLSLLNTWSGSGNEKWVPKSSTTLQILVSIQGLILNTKPFFNEPGFVRQKGSQAGEEQSKVYNESTFLLSLKTMLYSMRRPPKYFEDFVYGHFYKHAHDILIACTAYLDGAQVGSLVKGGVQDVDAGNKSSSKKRSCCTSFKTYLPGHINNLVLAFAKLGVKDCEKYSIAVSDNNPVAATTSNANRYMAFKAHMDAVSSYKKKRGRGKGV